MRIAYDVKTGRVFREVVDGETYRLPVGMAAIVEVSETYNAAMVAAFRAHPNGVTYNPSTDMFSHGGTSYIVSRTKEGGEAAFLAEMPTLAQALTAIDGVTNLAGAKVILAKLARALYAIAHHVELGG